MITFGDKDYAVMAVSGPADAFTFCTLEELVKGKDNRLGVYTSSGESIAHFPLGIEGSHIEVNQKLSRCLVYSYQMDAVALIDLGNGEVLMQEPCKHLYFMGFVNDRPIVQDSSRKVWHWNERTRSTSLLENSEPILAWAYDGNTRVVLDIENQDWAGNSEVFVQGSDLKMSFPINRRGTLAFPPEVLIRGGQILLTEANGGVRLFSIADRTCKIQIDTTPKRNFQCAYFDGTRLEIVALASIADDSQSPNACVFLRATPNQLTEVRRINFFPMARHFLARGRTFVSNTHHILTLSE